MSTYFLMPVGEFRLITFTLESFRSERKEVTEKGRYETTVTFQPLKARVLAMSTSCRSAPPCSRPLITKVACRVIVRLSPVSAPGEVRSNAQHDAACSAAGSWNGCVARFSSGGCPPVCQAWVPTLPAERCEEFSNRPCPMAHGQQPLSHRISHKVEDFQSGSAE